jgi:AraC family ethanolamine operon transcriptional activator
MSEQTTAPTPGTAPEVQSLCLHDVDALVEAIPSSRFEHVQVERGAFLAELKRVHIDDLTINSGCYTRRVIARGDFPPGSVLIGCVLDGREEGWINGYRFHHNDVVVYPKGSELDYIQPAATRWYAISLSEALLEQAGCQEIRVDRIKVMSGNWPLTQLIRELLHNQPDPTAGVARAASAPPPSRAILLDQVRRVLEHYQDHPDVRRPSRQRRMAMLRQFEHHVRERIAESLRLSELCSEVGVSQRVLEYVFKEELGMTPKQYLELLRLSAFRRELLLNRSGDPSITQIAGRHGISHLGRLSAAYRRQFGELPSETLGR